MAIKGTVTVDRGKISRGLAALQGSGGAGTGAVSANTVNVSGKTINLSGGLAGAAPGGSGSPSGGGGLGGLFGAAGKGGAGGGAAGAAGGIAAIAAGVAGGIAAVGFIKAGFDKLVAATPRLQAEMNRFNKGLKLWLRPLGEILANTLRPYTRAWLKNAVGFYKWWRENKDKVGAAYDVMKTFTFSGFVQAIKEGLAGIFGIGEGESIWFKLGDTIKDKIFGEDFSLTELIKEWFGGKPQDEEKTWEEFHEDPKISRGTVAKNALKNMWEKIKDSVSTWWSEDQEKVAEARAKTREYWEKTKETVGEWWDTTGDYLSEVWSGIAEKMSGFGEWFWEKLKTVWNYTKDFGKWIWKKMKSLWNYSKDFGVFIWDKLKSIWTWTYDFPALVWGWLKSTLRSLVGRGGDDEEDQGSKKISEDSPREMAIGGPIRKTGAVMAHAGEHILTAADVKDMKSTRAPINFSPTINIVNPVMDTARGLEEQAEEFGRLSERELRRRCSY